MLHDWCVVTILMLRISSMAVLLSKFRIDYSDLVIISDFNEAPKTKTRKWFDNLIRPLLRPDENGIILTISKEINCINNESF